MRCSTRRFHTQSRHAVWYSDIVPGMVPVALLGSAVYMALQLVRANLTHEQYLDEARVKISRLETRVDELLLQAPPPKPQKKNWWFS